MKRIVSLVFALILTLITGAVSVSAAEFSLQALINDAVAGGQTIVTVPPGATLISERVVISNPGLTINGNGNTLSFAIDTTSAAQNLINEECVMLVSADNVRIEDLNIINTAIYNNGTNQQAEAVRVTGNNCYFENVTLTSFENTLNIIGSAAFYNSEIIGNLTFVRGSGKAYFRDCEIRGRYTSYKNTGSYICAENVAEFIFSECEFTAEAGIADYAYSLARYTSTNIDLTLIDCVLGDAVNSGNPFSEQSGSPTIDYQGSDTQISYYGLTGREIPALGVELAYQMFYDKETQMIDDFYLAGFLSPAPPVVVVVTPPEPEPEPTPEPEPEPYDPPSVWSNGIPVLEPIPEITPEDLNVTAVLSATGSVNSAATAALVSQNAKYAKANGFNSITIEIPAGATGLSASTVQKLIKAANGTEIILKSDNLTLSPNNQTGQVLTGLYFETDRIHNAQNYITNKWDTDILGSFETAQKGGWGAATTLRVSMDKLGFSADDGTSLYALIYDSKTGKWYQVAAVIRDENVVIKTKRTGIITVISKPIV